MAESKYRKPKGKRKDTKEIMELRQGWHMQRALLEKQNIEIAELNKWIDDLQAGMYINCVYCGHRFESNPEVYPSMQDVLKEHMGNCPKHPLSKANKEKDRLRTEKEWVLDHYAMRLHETNTLLGKQGINKIKQRIVVEMKQALKEKG